mmetsp:Transcript_41343/g.75529  ORF Transcript_41343/g.75529 Transcript_41343/m.75529 type:complete len:1166 (+) Transcript_41343:54-3551(+)
MKSCDGPNTCAPGAADKSPGLNCLRAGGCVLLAAVIALSACGCEANVPETDDMAKLLNNTAKGDYRQYQYAMLDNGFRVLNVQDKRSLKSAFAVAVEAGSFADPKQLPGLAHFCEHMLFLGTEKYPDATGFDSFVKMNGGYNNAYTASEVTVYYAAVSGDAADEGLDRFADFFRAPLFDKQFVSKEVHAIDSEHAKNVQDPMRRILEVILSLGDPDSPESRFHTGNMETLYTDPRARGEDPMLALEKYFKSNYCPQRMTIVTVGSADVHEQLSNVKSNFGSIGAGHEGCSAEKPSYATPAPFPASRMGNAVNVKGSTPQSELWLHFALPDVAYAYKSQPLGYLNYVLSYSGIDSLTRVLQDHLGLVTSFQTSFDGSSAGTNVFLIMSLTKAGQKHTKLICSVIYAYLATLRRDGVNTNLYDSLKRSVHLKWDWAELINPIDAAEDLAERMTRLPIDHLLTGEDLILDPNATLVTSLLQQLTPSNMNLIFVDPKMDSNGTSNLDGKPTTLLTLEYYNVTYSMQRLSEVYPGYPQKWEAWLAGEVDANGVQQALQTETDAVANSKGGQQLLSTSGPSFASGGDVLLMVTGTASAVPPGPIEGVPETVPLQNMRASDGQQAGDLATQLFGPLPTKTSMNAAGSNMKGKGKKHNFLQEKLEPVPSNSGSITGDFALDVWYRRGWMTTSPKAQLHIFLQPPKAPTDPGASALDGVRLSLYHKLLSEEMQPKMVDLEEVGVTYGMSMAPGGLTFMFTGFTPTMPLLIEKVLSEFNSFNDNVTVKPSRYSRIVQEFRQGLTTYSEMPIKYAIADRDLLITKDVHSRDELLTALDNASSASVASAAGDVLLSKPLKLTSLAMGNMAKKEAMDTVVNFVSQVRRPAGLSVSAASGEVERLTPVVKLADPVEVRKQNPRKGDPNDAVVVSIMAGVGSVGARVRIALLGQILQPLAYEELRTHKQLGYVVSGGAARVSNVDYVSCVVQGNVLDADSTELAIEDVFHNLMPKRLQAMTDKEFNSYKESFRQELLTPPVRFSDEFDHYWGPVYQGGQCFDLHKLMMQYLDESLLSKDTLINEWNKLIMPNADSVRKKIVVKLFAGKVPPRLTDSKIAAKWTKQGFSKSTINLLQRERNRTTVLDRADSQVREQLVKKGGYFPTDLKCDAIEAETESEE